MATTAAPAVRPRDFLDIDRLLDDEERLIRDTVRASSRTASCPSVGSGSRRRGSRASWRTELGSSALLGMHLEGYGCAGASATAYGLACMELEAGDSGVRSLVSVQGSLAMFAIHRWGSEEQKQEWLPRMAAGEAIGCFGLTEPDSGSDPGAMRTRARRDGDGLGPPRAEDVDHQRLGRRRGGGVGAHGRRASAGSWCPRGTPGFTTQDIHASSRCGRR